MPNNYEQAIAQYSQIIENDPNNGEAFARRGEAYAEQGKYQQAISDLEQAINLGFTKMRTFAYRGLAYIKSGNFQQGIDKVDQGIELYPDNVDFYTFKGIANQQLDNHAQAILEFDRSLQLVPNSTFVLNARGESHRHERHYEQAMADINQAIQLNPKDEGLITFRADVYHHLGQHQAALADIERALALNPNNTFTHSRLAETYLWLEDLDRAREEFAHLVVAVPTQSEYLLKLAWLELLQGPETPISAMEHLRDAVIAQSNQYHAATASIMIYWLLNQLDNALPLLNMIDYSHAHSYNAGFWYGLIKAEQGQDQEASVALRQALYNYMPPVLLQTLRLVRGRPEFYEQAVKAIL